MNFLKFLDIRRFSKEDKYYFIFNVVLGLWALIFFVATRDTPMQQSLINVLFDEAIEIRAGIWEFGRECDAKIAAKNIVMLSFDDEAMKDLDRPYWTPRNKIADLIKFAYEGGASVVVLDMALSVPDYTPSHKLPGDSEPMSGLERDRELFNLLEKIKNDDSSNTKILLGSDIYTDQTLRGNIFSGLIDNKKIFAVAPKVSASRGNDRKVRFWIPYLPVTLGDDENKRTEILWSVQLMTLALMEGGEEELARIKDEILNGDDEKFTMHCKSGRDFVFYREIASGTGSIRDTQAMQYNRIQYVFKPQKISDKKSIDKELVGHWRNDGLDNPDIDFKNKIVIIGREDRECGDFLTTLIGRMPGLYVHGNALATVLGKTQPHISPLWKYILIEVILIIITAYAFVYLKFSGAKRFTFALSIVCGICMYAYFWVTNEFVYLTFSFGSLGVYNFVSRMEDFFKKWSVIKSKLQKKFRKKSDKGGVKLEK